MASAAGEPPLRYHPWCSGLLTRIAVIRVREQCQVGSLTGAVAS